MSIQIFIPTPLRIFAAKQDAVSVEATTVGEAMTQLVSLHPELKQHLYSSEGKLRSFVNVYLNDEDIRYLPQKDDTPVTAADALSIIPSIAGGGASQPHLSQARPRVGGHGKPVLHRTSR